LRRIIIIILLCPLLLVSAHADEVSENLKRSAGIAELEKALPEAATEISGHIDDDGRYDTEGALARLGAQLVTELKKEAKESLSLVSAIVTTALFAAAASALCSSDSIKSYINIASCCMAAIIVAGGVGSLLDSAEQALINISDFSKAAMPAVFTAALASGAVVSASAEYAAVCLAMDVIMTSAQKLVLPMIYAHMALSICCSVFENSLLRGISKTIRRVATIAMTAVTIAFSAYISITGLIAGSGDAVAVKTVKTVISTTLPVVGGIISDAASVIISATSIIKNSAGVLSLVAVCAICIGPFAALSVRIMLFRVAAAMSEMALGSKLTVLLGDIGSSMSLLLGLLGSSAIMFFVSIMAGIKVVT